MRASFISFIACAILMTVASVMFLTNYKEMSTETIIQLLFLMSIAWSMHTVHHYYEEVYYDFDPLQGKWTVYNQVQNKF